MRLVPFLRSTLQYWDQIQEEAITKHRDFIIEHVEPWLQRAERAEPSGSISPRDHGDVRWVRGGGAGERGRGVEHTDARECLALMAGCV